MKKLTQIGLIAMLVAMSLSAGYSCKEKCDTEDMSYKSDILPLMNENGCTNSGCHSAGDVLNYTDYDIFKTVVDANRVIGAINHQAGFSPMPKGGEKLSDCEIDKMEAWISQGAKNN